MSAATLTEIAAQINAHLCRFASDAGIARYIWVDKLGKSRSTTRYWRPSAHRGGSRCLVKYVAYQHEYSLAKDEASRYLAWLDAGNVGTHREALTKAEP